MSEASRGVGVISFLAKRAQKQRTTNAALRFVRDLASTYSELASSDNSADLVRRAVDIGTEAGAHCAQALSEQGAIPSWSTREAIGNQIASLMWPVAAGALKRGADPETLEGRLREIFMTLVDSLADQPEPEFVKLPEGLEVMLSEQRHLASQVIPQLLVVSRDRNARFYFGPEPKEKMAEMVKFCANHLRKQSRELTALLVAPGDSPKDDSWRIAYQSMFGTVAIFMGAAVASGTNSTFVWIRNRINSGSKPTATESSEHWRQEVLSHFKDGCELTAQAMSSGAGDRTHSASPQA